MSEVIVTSVGSFNDYTTGRMVARRSPKGGYCVRQDITDCLAAGGEIDHGGGMRNPFGIVDFIRDITNGYADYTHSRQSALKILSDFEALTIGGGTARKGEVHISSVSNVPHLTVVK